MNKNLYEILNVSKNATSLEIKKSYRNLALQYHPDKTNGDIEKTKKFQDMTHAYEILSDPDKRRNYDLLGDQQQDDFADFMNNFSNDNDFRKAMFDEMFRNFGSYNTTTFPDIDIKTLIETLMKNIIKKFFEKKKDVITESEYTDSDTEVRDYLKSTVNKNSDIFIIVECTIEEVYTRKKKKISYNFMDCDDEGEITKNNKNITINLYSDVATYNNKGNVYFVDGIKYYGNLIVKLKIKDEDFFKKSGNDLLIIQPFSLFELFNGYNSRIILPNKESMECCVDNFFNTEFDGEKVLINFYNKRGFPINDKERGDVKIIFLLAKQKDFNKKLKKFYK